MAKSVRNVEVLEQGNSEPTPLMKDVKVIPCEEGTPFKYAFLSDTGCTQSQMMEDLVSQHEMVINTRLKKRIKAVNNQKLEGSRLVTFSGQLEGCSTKVFALVSLSIQGEALLSWQTLKELGVFPDNFLHASARAAGETIRKPA